jgi:hypothetical protein
MENENHSTRELFGGFGAIFFEDFGYKPCKSRVNAFLMV